MTKLQVKLQVAGTQRATVDEGEEMFFLQFEAVGMTADVYKELVKEMSGEGFLTFEVVHD